jgi:hypothetical protein
MCRPEFSSPRPYDAARQRADAALAEAKKVLSRVLRRDGGPHAKPCRLAARIFERHF